MMKTILLTSVLTALAFMSCIDIGAQSPKRIHFAKGRSSAVARGNTGKYGTSFELRARSGQKIVIDVSPVSGVGLKVETKGSFGHGELLREERGGRFEIGLEETGDYTIFVGSLSGQPVAFTLSVEIKKLTDI